MQPLPVAMEQSYAERRLELLDPRRDARGHPMQLARRFDDAAFIDDGFEDLEIDEIHGCHIFCL
jgi:hypothetical protein